MRAWFDLLTPKQVLFFRHVISELSGEGHEVLATSRRYREVEQISTLAGLRLRMIGERGGKEPADQLRASLERMNLLLPVVEDFAPDVSVSVASSDCARISMGLRVKHVAVNDSPHSEVADRLSLPLSHKLLTPWIIPYSAWRRYGIARRQIVRYRALDPAAWLKRRNGKTHSGLNLDAARRTILVRLEESYAPYMQATDESWPSKVLDSLARRFADCNLVALCRYPDQLERVRERFGSSFLVPGNVVDGASLILESDVFVGMGGTMTTEAALLGIPTVSAYQGEGLYTERYLISRRLLLKALNPAVLLSCVERSLDRRYHDSCSTRAKALLDSMEDPVQRVVQTLESVAGGI